MKRYLSMIFVFLLLVGSVFALTELALSRVDYYSNDAELNKPAFSFLVTEDGRSEFGVGTVTDVLSDDEINGVSGSAEQVSKDLKISAVMSDSFYSYNVRSKGIDVNTVQQSWKKFYYFWDKDEYEADCNSQSGSFYLWKPSWSSSVYCFVLRKDGEYGYLEPVGWNFKERFDIDVGGSVTSLGLSNDVVSDQSEFAHISYVGNLGKGLAFPSPDTAGFGIAHKSSGGWVLVSKYNVETAYAPYFSLDRFSDCLDSKSDADVCMKELNDKSALALLSKPWSYQNEFLVMPRDNDVWGVGVATLKVKPLENPVFRLRVLASTLGVFLPVGKPEIQKVSSSCFTEGDGKGSISVDVKNVGSVDASFDFSAVCNNPFSFVGGAKIVKVGKGEVVNVVLPIESVTSDAEFKSSCTVKVVDSESSKYFDTEKVDVCVKNAPSCTSGQVRCLDGVISKCDADGNWAVVQKCADGCEGKNAGGVQEYACKDADGQDGDGVKEGDDFSLWVVIGIIAGMFVFLFAGLFFQNMVKGFGEQYRWVGWVLGGLVGGVVGVLIWVYNDVIEFLIGTFLVVMFLFLLLWIFVLRRK